MRDGDMLFLFFGFRLLGFVCTSAVLGRLPTGGSPVATYFSCFAKKRKQKKATQSRCPYGYPPVQVKKWGMKQTR
ncbi:hypothetical protein, partial [Undibacterium sp.]|uniref:hypothetical protein n=1 Tax=Undibacterium sp. TaxID=1914977 RepID=UPI0025F5F3E7